MQVALLDTEKVLKLIKFFDVFAVLDSVIWIKTRETLTCTLSLLHERNALSAVVRLLSKD